MYRMRLVLLQDGAVSHVSVDILKKEHPFTPVSSDWCCLSL